MIEFEDERGIDQGGVTRDMFSAFWDKCYAAYFDGSNALVPLLHPQSNPSIFSTLGRVISHGYIVSGFLPIRIALPTLICILCGPSTVVPQEVLQNAFLDYISDMERALFNNALSHPVFAPDTQEGLLNVLSRFGCRQLPTPANLRMCLQQIAQYEFCCKPAAAISLIHAGIPSSHLSFWSAKAVDGICSLYRCLAVSYGKIINILKFSDFRNSAEVCVSGYLVEMLGNMSIRQLQNFLRFVTGSSVLIATSLMVEFNGLSGLARRPIAHTCDNLLELY